MIKTHFSADFYTGNRKYLRERIEAELIVVTASGQLQRSADTTYPFQQDTNFLYLTGVQEPDVLLVIEGDNSYLIRPKTSVYQEVFDGVSDHEVLQNISGVDAVYKYEEGWKKLRKKLKTARDVAIVIPPPEYIDVYGIYTNPARWALRRSILGCNETIEFVDVRQALTEMRMIKQEPEIAAIRQAINITKIGLEEITKRLKNSEYNHEYEVEADLTREFRRQNSQHAFDPIIASGERACTLHNIASSGQLAKGELILLDVGAAYEGYAADITRTVAITEPTVRQQQVYEAVLDAQKYAYSLLKPGVVLAEYEKQVERYIGEKLILLGLIKKNQSDAVRKYYPHAASHHLGLDVHDADDRKSPLAPNMVITVEPGIYIPEEGIGVRIEDDVRITEDGVEVLSSSLPASLN
jgi:Xaa-Pro aminopeptidase